MKRRTLLPCLLLALTGCGDDPLRPGRFVLDGTWEGRAFPYELSLRLTHDGDNRIGGDGELRGLREVITLTVIQDEPLVVDTAYDTLRAETVALDVSGEWAFPTYTLVLSAPDFAEATYAGGWAQQDGAPLPDALEGRLEGSGFGGVVLPLRRTP